jgi:hypothetical protein
VHQNNGIAVTLLPDEAADAARVELPARSPMLLNRLGHRTSHELIIALCGFTVHRGLSSLLRWRGKPL